MTMPEAIITDLAKYRMRHQKPITDACGWVTAFETVAVANMKAAAVMQRMFLRMWIPHL
jgi:hypothetical protein